MSVHDLEKISREELIQRYLDLQLRVSRFSSVEQALINTKDRLDAEMVMHKRMNQYLQKAFLAKSEQALLQLTAESTVDIFEFELAGIFLIRSGNHTSFQMASEGFHLSREQGHQVLQLLQRNLNFYADGIVLKLGQDQWTDFADFIPFHQLMLTRLFQDNRDWSIYLLGGVSLSGAGNYNPLVSQRTEAFANFAQQVVAQLTNLQNTGLISRSENRLAQLASVFLSFGSNPLENIYQLNQLAGTLLKADYAFYKGIGKMDLFNYFQLENSSNVQLELEDILFVKSIVRASDQELVVVKQMPPLLKAQREKNGKHNHPFRAFGKKVMLDGLVIGVLGVCFENNASLDDEELQLLNIIASAIAVEEKRYTAAKALKESESRSSALLDGTPHGAIIVDPESGKLIYGNPAFCVMFNCSIDELKNIQFRTLQEEQFWLDMQRFNSSDNLSPAEYSCFRKDHSMFQAEISYKHILIDDKPYWACFYVDLSEQKKIQKELQVNNIELKKINSELDNFVYSVSHDLRAPLLAIKGLISLIQSGGNPEGANEELLELINDSVIRMDDTIKEILEYSRNARLSVKPERINLEDMVKMAFKDVQFYSANPITLELDIDTEAEFWADRARLNTVIKNLITNSVKYAKTEVPGAFVKVTAKVDNKDFLIVVSDNGEGISQTHLNKVFQMFFRASSNTHGTGLGLYIASEIVQKLMGKIWIESEKNKGTSVFVRLPLVFPNLQ